MPVGLFCLSTGASFQSPSRRLEIESSDVQETHWLTSIAPPHTSCRWPKSFAADSSRTDSV
ncbi:hypothetical protein EA472_22390 [Natrarchaeobius oligotrophus]|uniref:Uncharacterized protein n=1 Tax=Natrarchaeobius chitinivorans TaxID=1679083 RepID=A0A3N6MJ52_NATCH|nr:hypothetical protein EA472_22390 [Natrarchaeobius chitinivorans]